MAGEHETGIEESFHFDVYFDGLAEPRIAHAAERHGETRSRACTTGRFDRFGSDERDERAARPVVLQELAEHPRAVPWSARGRGVGGVAQDDQAAGGLV